MAEAENAFAFIGAALGLAAIPRVPQGVGGFDCTLA